MRAIVKGKEPPSLMAHRMTPCSDYDNYTHKCELRTALVAEQRGLCCYCMGRIHSASSHMKIEHWRCQANYPNKQLNYRNLLGACLGGEGQPMKLQHCDTRKGDSALRWNPAEQSHRIEKKLAYGIDGTICSSNPDFCKQLNEVLNLNIPLLKHNRRGVLKGVLDWWKRERRSVSERRLKKEIANRERPGRLDPYAPVAVCWLQKKLVGMKP